MRIVLQWGLTLFILCVLICCKNDTENEKLETSKVVNFEVKSELDSVLSALNSKYPHFSEKEFYCFSFIGQGNISFLERNSNLGYIERVETEQYKFIDSIASIYNKRIAYFLALKNNDTIGLTDKFLQNAQFENVLVLNNSDKLFAILSTLKPPNLRNLVNVIFIIDKNGNLAYYSPAGVGNKNLFLSLSNFIKSHQN